MARQLLRLVLAIVFASAPVYGGSRAWEPSIMHTARIQSLQNPTLQFGENATIVGRSSPASNLLNSRYVTITAGTQSHEAKIWPKRTITICFESEETRLQVQADLLLAHQLWVDAGLSKDFKLDFASKEFCNDESNRSKFLLVRYNTNGRLATTVGIRPTKFTGPRPTMDLSDSLEVGMLNVVPNYAHELGHAWGMHHEHQNQRFWTKDYSASGGKIFGEGNWNCKNLKDYDSTRQRMALIYGEDNADKEMKKLCTSRVEAQDIRFSAHDYLPIIDEPLLASTKSEPDWKSIMIYPSGAGGKGSGTLDNDQRLPILLKPDGTRIDPVDQPSDRDVKGLTELYGGKSGPLSWLPFGDKASTSRNIFGKLRKEEPDSGCT